MQYQQTPQGLQTLFGDQMPTAGMPQAMQLLGQQQYADQLTQADQARELNYRYQEDPLLLQQKDLANQTTAAELPGHVAKSGMLTRQNANEAATNDAKIKDILGQYSTAEINRHVQDAENAGTRLSQMGEEAFSNPIGAAQRVKGELQTMGLGHLWNPQWETSDPGLLARQLGDYGKDLQQTSAKFRAQMQLQDLKNSAVEYSADQRLRAAQIAAAQRQASTEALMSTKRYIANIPKGLEDYATKMRAMANQAETPEERQKYLAEADSAERRKGWLNAQAAATTTAQKLNFQKLLDQDGVTWGQPGQSEPPPMTPTPPMPGAQPPGGNKAPEGWPEGAVQNPDGTVTYNGTTYRKRQ